MRSPPTIHRSGGGFTLTELLVVLAVIASLAALLLPTLSTARDKARRAGCISHLRQVGLAIHLYADDYDGRIPYGPTAPPFTSPASFYPTTGSPTSLLSLQSGAPVGLGLLLANHLGQTPKVLFCPGRDQPLDADAELRKVGQHQAQGSYLYRHGGNTELFRGPVDVPPSIRIENPGTNRNGRPITALALDMNFLTPPGLESFNVITRTHHRARFAQSLHTDGSVVSRRNTDARYTVNVREYADLHNAFDRILTALEHADDQR